MTSGCQDGVIECQPNWNGLNSMTQYSDRAASCGHLPPDIVNRLYIDPIIWCGLDKLRGWEWGGCGVWGPGAGGGGGGPEGQTVLS